MLALETDDLEKGSAIKKPQEALEQPRSNRYRNDPEIYQMENDLSMHKVTHKNPNRKPRK